MNLKNVLIASVGLPKSAEEEPVGKLAVYFISGLGFLLMTFVLVWFFLEAVGCTIPIGK